MSDDQFLAWLQDPAAAHMVLIEAQVNVAGQPLLALQVEIETQAAMAKEQTGAAQL